MIKTVRAWSVALALVICCAPRGASQTAGGDDLEVPVHRQAGLRVEILEAASGEGRQVAVQQELVLRLCQEFHGSGFPIEKRALICSRTFSSASLKSEVSGAVGSV